MKLPNQSCYILNISRTPTRRIHPSETVEGDTISIGGWCSGCWGEYMQCCVLGNGTNCNYKCTDKWDACNSLCELEDAGALFEARPKPLTYNRAGLYSRALNLFCYN